MGLELGAPGTDAGAPLIGHNWPIELGSRLNHLATRLTRSSDTHGRDRPVREPNGRLRQADLPACDRSCRHAPTRTSLLVTWTSSQGDPNAAMPACSTSPRLVAYGGVIAAVLTTTSFAIAPFVHRVVVHGSSMNTCAGGAPGRGLVIWRFARNTSLPTVVRGTSLFSEHGVLICPSPSAGMRVSTAGTLGCSSGAVRKGPGMK
jgi:hypothetical protein